MRSRAPEALLISPQTSPSSRADEAASIDSIKSCSSTPAVMVWSTKTARAQRNRTPRIPVAMSRIIRPVMVTRARMKRREAAKACSSDWPKWPEIACSWPKASTVSRPSRPSPAWAMASAKRSWAWVDRRRRRSAKTKSGARPSGSSTTTRPVKLGLTASNRATAPSNVRVQRSATGPPLVTIRSTIVMSVVMRDSSSPVRTFSTWAMSSSRTCR